MYGASMQHLSFDRHCFPPWVIRYAVWLYARFTLSYRDVEDLLAERGLDVACETVRRWCLKFRPATEHNLGTKCPPPGDPWHLRCWLWRAAMAGRVDNEGEVLDFLLQYRRNTAAVAKLMRKLPKRQLATTCVTTDKLQSYSATFRNLGLSGKHVTGKRTNNRAENSHQPLRRRERKMQRFKSPGSAQRFLNLNSATCNNFYFQRHLIDRTTLRHYRGKAFESWTEASPAA